MTSVDLPPRLSATPWGQLPPRLKVLFIRGPRRTGGWLAEAFAADSASEITLVERQGMAAGLAELRDDAYDAVLISQEAGNLESLDVLDTIRAGSRDHQPIVVLGEEDEAEMAALCFEAGADAYVCLRTATTRSLIYQVARAVERHDLLRENRQLKQARRAQQEQERNEAQRLLAEQRSLKDGLPAAGLRPGDRAEGAEPPLPEPLVTHYRELLRTYVMMGAGQLSAEMQPLCLRLVSRRIAPRQVLQLHLAVVEELIGGLGSRSTRHVLNRADLLLLQVLSHLAEAYRAGQRGQG